MIFHLYSFQDKGQGCWTLPQPDFKEPKDFKEAIRRQLYKNPADDIKNYLTFLVGTFDDQTGVSTVEKTLVCVNAELLPKKEDSDDGKVN